MADAAEVTRYARTLAGLTVATLVPNARGAENALAAGAQQLSMPISVSRSHNAANIRKTHDQSIEELKKVRALADALPRGTQLSVLVDESGLRQHAGRAADTELRLTQRRAAWQRLLHDLSLPAPRFIDLAT